MFPEEEMTKEVFASSLIVLTSVKNQLPLSYLPSSSFQFSCQNVLCAIESPGSEAALGRGVCTCHLNNFQCIYAPGWCLQMNVRGGWIYVLVQSEDLNLTPLPLPLPLLSPTKEKCPS